MAVKLKEEANKEVKGELVSFNNDKDYVAIVLKSDNKTYVEHKLFAQKLVESYHGKISVSSTLGSGSKFMIEFPLLKSKQENK